MNQTKKTKTIYLIRHAESEENRRLASLRLLLSSVALPWRRPWATYQDVTLSLELLNLENQIDSDVSPEGLKQIEMMAERLRQEKFLEEKKVQLIVHSPLLRARKTCQGILGIVTPENKSQETVSEPSKASESKQRVVQLEDLKERTPREWLPFSKESYEARIKSVVTWLGQQDEDVVAIVGHSQFFKTMLGLDYKFGNCDVWEIYLDHEIDTSSSSLDSGKRNHNWRDLKQLHSLC